MYILYDHKDITFYSCRVNHSFPRIIYVRSSSLHFNIRKYDGRDIIIVHSKSAEKSTLVRYVGMLLCG